MPDFHCLLLNENSYFLFKASYFFSTSFNFYLNKKICVGLIINNYEKVSESILNCKDYID